MLKKLFSRVNCEKMEKKCEGFVPIETQDLIYRFRRGKSLRGK